MEGRTQMKKSFRDKIKRTWWPIGRLEVKERHFNTKYIYSWLSQSTMRIPPPDGPKHIHFLLLEGKSGGDLAAGAKKRIHFKEVLDFIGVLSPFKRPENLRWSPY